MKKIVVFSYVLPGAMGAPGAIKLIDSESNVLEASINSIEKVTEEQSVLKIIQSSEQFFLSLIQQFSQDFWGSDSMDGWRPAYLGMGNFLFVRDEYFEDFKSLSTKKGIKTPYDLYSNWMAIIKDILNQNKE